MATPATATATVVTCYYRIPSKHSYDSYDAWSERFLASVDTPMVIFCDAGSAARLAALRARVADRTRVVVLPLDQTRCGGGRLGAHWPTDVARDPEAHIHNPALYAIWNNKADFVQRVVEENPFATDAFAWCDIGCFRSDDPDPERFRRWPEGAALDAACTDPARRARLTLLNIEPFQSGDFRLGSTGLPPSFERVCRIGGTIMVGHRDAWCRWTPAYRAMLDRFVEGQRFAGKDQNVMATLCVLRPDLIALVAPTFRREDGDPWFHLLGHFAPR